MTFQELIDSLQSDTIRSLQSFGPELALSVTIILMLLVRVFAQGRTGKAVAAFISSWLPLAGSLVALYLAAPWIHLTATGLAGASPPAGEIFTGLLVYDEFTIFVRAFLMVFLVLFVIFTRISGIPDTEDASDFYSLVLGSVIGMCLMASANHLLIVFLGVEMASVPAYVLAGMLKGRRQASEAAIKFAIYGAGAAGVMLYGISLLAGVLGTFHLPTLAFRLAEHLQDGASTQSVTVLVLAGFMIMVGLAFKLSAVPFHFWAPDVFEGASAEVGGFLSVASKAAALALLVRLSMGLAHVNVPIAVLPATGEETAVVAVAPQGETFVSVDVSMAVAEEQAQMTEALEPARQFMAMLIGVLAAVTCTFGNLAAYAQTNIKRLLAYSTIAHAGYMMMPVAAAVAIVGSDPASAKEAVGYLAFYIAAYLFMNLGAFAIVAFLRNAMRSEEIADYAGLLRREPLVVVSFVVILLSLLGLPPLVGFLAKARIFLALVSAQMWWLLAIGGINTFLSLFYYVRVAKVMTIDPEPEDRLPDSFPLPGFAKGYAFLLSLPILLLGIWGNQLMDWTLNSAAHLLP